MSRCPNCASTCLSTDPRPRHGLPLRRRATRRGTCSSISPCRPRRPPPAHRLHWMSEGRISVHVLGRTQVETLETKIEGDWLLRRPGHLLKYLICQRGSSRARRRDVEALSRLRRERPRICPLLRARVAWALEPGRAPRATSSFIVSRRDLLTRPSVSVDLDEFEALWFGRHASQRLGRTTARESHCWNRRSTSPGDLFPRSRSPNGPSTQASGSKPGPAAVRLLCGGAGRQASLPRPWGTWSAAQASAHRHRSATLADPAVPRDGRRSDAQRRFEALRRRLREDFNREPGSSLRSWSHRSQ